MLVNEQKICSLVRPLYLSTRLRGSSMIWLLYHGGTRERHTIDGWLKLLLNTSSSIENMLEFLQESIMKNINSAKHDFYSERTSEINETHVERSQTTYESLQSEKAQQILPYLTLDKLDEREVSGLLDLSNDAIDAMDQGKLPRDKFSTITTLEEAIAVASGEEAVWAKGEISPKLAQARKLICASLLNETDDEKPERKWEIYNSFFGMSPDIASYCGGLRGSLELLTIAERTSQNPCAGEIYEEIIYDYSFKEQNDFKRILRNATPIQQLRLIPIYNKVALHCDTDNYSKKALSKVIQALTAIENDKQSKPLIRLAASQADDNVKQWFNAELIEVDYNNPEYQVAFLERKKKQLAWREEQERIRETYPGLPKGQPLSIIAPGVAGALDGSGNITQISNRNGERLSLLNCSKDNVFGLDKNTAFLISATHNPEIERIIGGKISLELRDIPLGSQVQLLKYMTEADSNRFDELCNTLKIIDKTLRLKLAENFVAADFGEDFGDSLLEIVDSKRFSDKEKEQILDGISSCRKSIDDIAGWYKDYGKDDDKGNFAKQYRRAANERLTDVITVFRELARNGTVAVNSGRGKKKIAFNRRLAIEALGYETRSLEIINGTVRDITDGEEGAFAEVVIPPDRTLSSKNRTVYSLYSPRHGYVLLHTRPEGTHSFDPQLEYGKVSNRYDANSTNTGTEASISFITNPVEPFSLPTPYKDLPWVKHRRKKLKINKEKSSAEKAAEDYKHDRVSAIRLDREGRSPGMPADDPNRDPIAPFGMVSVDLSAIGDGPSTPSGKIARLITVGNTLRAQERGNNETYLNHNTEGFSHDKYGTAEGFAKIVRYIDVRMQKMIEDHPPGTGEGLVKKWEKLAEQEELELELAQTRNQRLGEDAMVGAIQTSPILPPAETPNTSESPDTPESSDTPESQGTPMSA